MKNTIIYLTLAVLLLVNACTNPTSPSETDQPLTIGAILPLSGGISTYGQKEKQGIDLAVEQINHQGGINGKSLNIIFEDSQGDPKTAVAAYQKLSQTDKIKYFVTCCSSQTLAMSPLVEQDKNIMISIAAHPDITQNPYIIRNLPSTHDYARILTRFITENNPQTIGIIYINNDLGIGAKQAFIDNLLGHDININQELYNSDDSDFKTQIMKILDTKPQAMFVVGDGNQKLGLLIKQIREFGFTDTILSTAEFNTPDVLEAAGSAAENVIFSDFYADYKNDLVAQNFKQKLFDKYDSEPSFDSILGYNQILILTDALKKIDDPNNIDQLIQTLKNNLNVEVIGGHMTGIPDREIKYELRLMTIQDGKAAPLTIP